MRVLQRKEIRPDQSSKLRSDPFVEVSARLGLLSSLSELVTFRGLFWTVTRREVKVRYSQSLLGIAWAIGQPLVLMVAFTVFFGRFVGMASDGLPYPLFSYTGLLPWTFFATSLTFGVSSLVTNTALVTKVYFPREILPLASVVSAGVDLLAGLTAYVPLMAVYQVWPTPAMAYLVPLLFLQLEFTIAVTLTLAAINVFYRDVRYALPLLTQVWLYATPVIYPLSVIPEGIRSFYLMLNPMAAVVDGYRSILAAGSPPDLSTLAGPATSSGVFLVCSYMFFKRAERSFADVI